MPQSNGKALFLTILGTFCSFLPCNLSRLSSCIQWTPETESAFLQLQEALSAGCELYIPSPDVNIAGMRVHATMESVLSWNNDTLKGSGSLALVLAAS